MSFLIQTSGTPGCTQVPNDILLHYILRAGGDYIKVYLLLLMASQNPGIAGEMSVEALADRMELTERDITRILHYWEREGVLALMESEGSIGGITLQHPACAPDSGGFPPPATAATGTPHLRVLNTDRDIPEPAIEADTGPSDNDVPERVVYTSLQIDALSRDEEMQQTLAHVEASLGGPVSPAHMQLVMYLICDLGFSGDLVSYLYQMAADRHKTKPRYLETIAIDWSKKGIRTVAQARAESADFSGKYKPVKQALGFHRDLAPAEREIVDAWDTFGFSTELIEEACKRTVLQTGDTNLNYTTKILEGWHKNGVKSLTDVQRADEAFHKNNKPKRARAVNGRSRPGNNAFQNFKQRDYSDEDYEDMERQLLQRRSTQ